MSDRDADESAPEVPTRGGLRTVRAAVALVWASGRTLLLLILVATIVNSVAIAAQLLVGRQLLDLLAGSSDVPTGELVPWLIALGAMLLLGALSQAVANELRAPLAEQVQRRAMSEILDMGTEVELSAYEDNSFHDRLVRAQSAAGGQSTAVVFGLVTMISALFVAGGIIIVLLTVAPILLPIAILGYVPVALVNVRNNRATYALEREQTELLRERYYLEAMMTDRSEAKEVRSYGLAPTLRRWHHDLWELRMSRLHALARKRLARAGLASLVATLALLAALSVAVIMAAQGSLTLGDVAAAVVGLQQLSARLQAAGSGFNSVHAGVTFLRDFDSFRAGLPELRERRPMGRPPLPPTVVTVDRVGYRYPGAGDDAVREVSLELRRGQVMAIVGVNGSGKTTLTKMLCGLLPPARGTITWDGTDLAGCDPDLVRSQIAPVFQDYSRFMFTIRQVIGLGDPARLDDDSALREAATQAGLDGLLSAHPAGLDTRLGKAFSNGIDVSGGQWQRLAIARALFRDAPVVILDEPSASLDPQAEADLFDLLRDLRADRIVIFVSHRFATVRSADLVLVLDQGDVVEAGTHDELMERHGLYHDLFTLQAARYGLAG